MPPKPHIAVGSWHGPEEPSYDIRYHRLQVTNGRADQFSVSPNTYPIGQPAECNPQARATGLQSHETYTPVSTAVSNIAS